MKRNFLVLKLKFHACNFKQGSRNLDNTKILLYKLFVRYLVVKRACVYAALARIRWSSDLSLHHCICAFLLASIYFYFLFKKNRAQIHGDKDNILHVYVHRKKGSCK